jgi:hypothetical protein
VLDADLDEVLEMPSESPMPLVLAIALSLVFVLLLVGHYVIALGAALAALLVVAAWHLKEPQDG